MPLLDVNTIFIDLLYQAKSVLAPSVANTDDIVIVDINDKSLWIIQRPAYLAKLIEVISLKGSAKVIGVDILFDDLKHPGPPEKLLKNVPLDCSEKGKMTHEEMVLACIIQSDYIADVILAVFSKKTDNDKHTFVYPIKSLMEASAGLGYINNPLDKDGIHRKSYLWVDDIDFNKSIYTMPMVIAILETGSKPVVDKNNNDIVHFNNNKIHKLEKGSSQFHILPELLGPNLKFKYVSVNEIRAHYNDEKYLRKIFKDKIVLVGTSSMEQQDLKRTPFTRFNQTSNFDGLMPGVEYHANTLLSLLNNTLFNYLPLWVNILWAILIIIISVFLMLKLRLIIAVIINLLLLITCFFAAFYIFIEKYLILQSLGTTLLTLLVAMPVCYTFMYLKEKKDRDVVESDKKQLMGLFDRYVSPDVANLIWNNKDQIILTGESKVATVVFTDIRGFTTLSESQEPKNILAMLNEYFEEMSKIIYQNNGNLNKFIGDGLMILFGLPITTGESKLDAYNSVKAAISMIEAVEMLNKRWEGKYQSINIGIGIHTGEVIVGNIGSSKRLEYSALGDTVNLASRLEGLNKEYYTNIIISEDTYNLLKDEFKFRYIDSTKVKGRLQEVKIYTIDKSEEKQQ